MSTNLFTKINKELALPTLKIIIDKIDWNYCWVDSGTLLGIYRDNDFILHDTDIDIGVIASSNRQIQTLDYPIKYFLEFNGKPMQIVYNINGIDVDLWYWWDDLEEGKIINITKDGFWRMKNEIILPIQKYRWKDINIPVPNNIEEALLFQYADWKIPRKQKRPWFLDANNLEELSILKYYEK